MCTAGARRTLRRLGEVEFSPLDEHILTFCVVVFEELEAYASVISAFRAQGQLSNDKRSSLEVLCKCLG